MMVGDAQNEVVRFMPSNRIGATVPAVRREGGFSHRGGCAGAWCRCRGYFGNRKDGDRRHEGIALEQRTSQGPASLPGASWDLVSSPQHYLGVVGYSFFCCCSSFSSNSSAFGLTRGPVMPVLAGGSLAGKLSSSALSCWSLCLFILVSLYRHSNAPSHSPVQDEPRDSITTHHDHAS